MRLNAPPGAPGWALQLVEQVNRALAEFAWPRIRTVASAAERPSAVGAEGRALWVRDRKALVISDGSGWVDAGGDGAWTAFTPSVEPQSGALVSYTAHGRYRRIGPRTVALAISIKMTDAGSAGGGLRASLPSQIATSGGLPPVMAGRENAVLGYMVQGIVGHTTVYIQKFDNGAPIGTGHHLHLSGVYEAVAAP